MDLAEPEPPFFLLLSSRSRFDPGVRLDRFLIPFRLQIISSWVGGWKNLVVTRPLGVVVGGLVRRRFTRARTFPPFSGC